MTVGDEELHLSDVVLIDGFDVGGEVFAGEDSLAYFKGVGEAETGLFLHVASVDGMGDLDCGAFGVDF